MKNKNHIAVENGTSGDSNKAESQANRSNSMHHSGALQNNSSAVANHNMISSALSAGPGKVKVFQFGTAGGRAS